MDYEIFKDILIHELNNRLSDYTIQIQPVLKNNNVVLTGIHICCFGSNYGPCFYLENLYKDYLNGFSVDNIIDNIFHICTNPESTYSADIIELDNLFNWDMIKSSIKLCVVNASSNHEMLKNMPFISYFDLAVIFYCDFGNGRTCKITNAILERWNIDETELLETAKANMENECYSMMNMETFRSESMPSPCENPDSFLEKIHNSGEWNSFALLNKNGTYGSSSIYSTYYLNLISQIFESSYYIIPSSIHELIFVKKDFVITPEGLKTMVGEVNQDETCISKEDILSYNIYYYDKDKKELSIL